MLGDHFLGYFLQEEYFTQVIDKAIFLVKR
jgi:hypothetical protein